MILRSFNESLAVHKCAMSADQRPVFKSIDKRKFSASPPRKLYVNEEPAQNEKVPRDRSLLKE